MLRRAAMCLVPLLVVATACTQKASEGADVETVNDTVDMKISVVMKGEREVTITDRTVPMTYVLVGEGGGPSVKPLLGVQAVEHVLEGNVRVLTGFAVKNFKGKGTYTIEEGTPREDLDADGAGKVGSSIRVEWWPVDGEPFEYLRRAKPCTVQVADDEGARGRLRCPDVTHEAAGGPHFSLDFRWERV